MIPIRRVRWTALCLAIAALTGCTNPEAASIPRPVWSTGFWFWYGSASDNATMPELDAIYFQAGVIRDTSGPYSSEPWAVYAEIPASLPAASEYWIVFRYDRQAIPGLDAVPYLAQKIRTLRADAERRGLPLHGVQLDIDSPTLRLADYAEFLAAVRAELPDNMELSITALLDWFRDGTSVGDVIAQVDEFVPQFYDLGDPASYEETAIAAPIDADRWGPLFARFGKRYKIGISTFGRARMVVRNQDTRISRGLTPLDLGLNPGFDLSTSTNDAQELVLRYRATRPARLGYQELEAGDTIEFVLPTPATVEAAVASAKQMPGPMGGMIFFRWPNEAEVLTMAPEEVLAAAGLTKSVPAHPLAVVYIDGGCVSVDCVDLYLADRSPLSPQPVSYTIATSGPLEYFLPNESLPIKMTQAGKLELSLPPYTGRGRMYLGRAVSEHPVEFTVDKQ